MRGQILETPGPQGDGLVLGEDGKRYRFSLAAWRAPTRPLPGISVDFVVRDGFADELYPLPLRAAQPLLPRRQPPRRTVRY